MMHRHNPPGVPLPVGRYAHGLELDSGQRLLFISGQIPETANGTVPAEFGDQCRLVWTHVGAVLQSAGLTYASLVKVTTFLTDRAQADENGRVRREMLGTHEPALTVVVVQTLESRWLLEIEAIAASISPGHTTPN